MLRKVFLFVLLLSPLVVRGQLLSVTATLTDPDGTLWVNGTCSVQVYSPNGAPFFGSTPVPTSPQACSVNGSGVLTTSIYNTSTLTPIGAQYRFNINSATSAPGSSFLTPVTAANMTSTLSALLDRPRFSAAIAYTYGYADVEAIATAPGGQYFKTTATAGTRIWNGSAWTSGGGGGGGCTAAGTIGVVQASNGSGVCQTTAITDNGTTVVTSEPFKSGTVFLGASSQVGYNAIGFSAGISAGAGFVGIQGNSNSGADPNLYINTIPSGHIILGNSIVNLLDASSNTLTTPGGVLPSISAAAVVAQAVCVKAAGPPIIIGTCSTVVSAGGACTCI